jgi:TolB-like protein
MPNQKNKIILFLAVFFFNAWKATCEEAPTLAVMNFWDRNQNPEWQWLSKGLPHMLVTTLSRTKKFNLLDRQQMQELWDEMKLSETGLVDADTAARFGRMAHVEKALFGSFWVEGKTLKIEAHVIDVASQAIEQVESVTGPIEKALELPPKLAHKLLANRSTPLTAQELTLLQYKPTDSIPAARHFYQGLDAYDKGQYPMALLEFQQASKQDMGYATALFQIGQMYRFMGEHEHAVLAYNNFCTQFPKDDMTDDALFHVATLYQKKLGQPKKALEIFDALLANFSNGSLPPGATFDEQISEDYHSGSPVRAFLHYAKHLIFHDLGLYEKAVTELCDAVTAAEETEVDDYSTILREPTIRKYVETVYKQTGKTVMAKRGAIILSPEKPDCRGTTTWRNTSPNEIFLTAEPGYNFSTISIRMTEVDNFLVPVVNDPLMVWEPPTYDQRANPGILQGSIRTKTVSVLPWTTILEVDFDCPGFPHDTHDDDKIRHVTWQISATFLSQKDTGHLKIDTSPGPMITMDPPDNVSIETGEFWNHTFCMHAPCHLWNIKAGLHKIVVDSLDENGAGWRLNGQRFISTVTVEPGKTTVVKVDFPEKAESQKSPGSALPGWEKIVSISSGILCSEDGTGLLRYFQDRRGRFWLLWHGNDDFWSASSPDGVQWTSPKILPPPINSTEKETVFDIFVGEDNSYWIAFESLRDKKSQLYLSQSRDMEKWSNPVVVAENAKQVRCIPFDHGTFLLYAFDQTQGQWCYFRVFPETGKISLKTRVQCPDLLEMEKWGTSRAIFRRSPASSLEMLAWDQTISYRRPVKETSFSSTLLTLKDGVHWTSLLSQPQFDEVSQKDLFINPQVIQTNDGRLALAWYRIARLAFSQSKDGLQWSKPMADETLESRMNNPGSIFSFFQDQEGVFRLAFFNAPREGDYFSVSNQYKLSVAQSKDPFQ